jgi:hypothetical protein
MKAKKSILKGDLTKGKILCAGYVTVRDFLLVCY